MIRDLDSGFQINPEEDCEDQRERDEGQFCQDGAAEPEHKQDDGCF